VIATDNPRPPTAARKPNVKSKNLRVAVICDFVEEGWPSMDLVGNMLHANLREHHHARVDAELIRPKLPFATGTQPEMLSRLFGRFLHYPRALRRLRREFDLFHIVDHSYAHLAHELPAERTIVTCHDIDAFRSLIGPGSRSFVLRAVARRVLSGMQRAARVTCDTEATRRALVENQLMPEEKLSVVHNGVHPALKHEEDSEADAELSQMLGRPVGAVTELLHVGSTIRRKRIDTLLLAFAGIRHHYPDCRLLRVGGEFTGDQKQLAASLGISSRIDRLPHLSERQLAAAYRRAAVAITTSEAEGFGLPMIEAMACGTPMVASDITPLREVGGGAATYCPVGDAHLFTAAVLRWLAERAQEPTFWQERRLRCITQCSQFSWSAYAAKMAEIYEGMIS
jgi:glycosyltransferase involved in cell wall biosynthesis